MALQANKGSGGDLDQLKALLGASGGAGGSSGGGLVYMGEGPSPSAQGAKNMLETEHGRVKATISNWMSRDDAYGDFFGWSSKRQRDFLAAGIISGAGGLKLGDGPMEASKLWKKLVDEAAMYGKAGKRVTPFDILSAYVGASGGKGAWKKSGDFEINTATGERRYVGPRFKTTTNSRVDLTDPDTARAIATKLFQDMMGRDPSAGEMKGFANALHTAEQNSPVVETSTTEFNTATGEPMGTSTTSSGGLTSDARAYIGEQQIKKKKEYGVTQAVTTYQNALEALVYGAPE